MNTSIAVMRTLAAVAVMAFAVWTVTDAEKVSPCCVSVSRSRVVEPIKSFRLQEKNLPCVKAVIFETENGHFCIDPRQPWVHKTIKEIRKSRKTTVTPTSVSPRMTSSAPLSSTAGS
ncbi:hypothetical protein NFI96_021459 [Prochilodus magdalenae]|nr:hypothetical protein NFI96_021459 [Prochilodus magdalenae]